MALQCQRSQYPSEGRKQLQFLCGLCSDFWPSQPLASQPPFGGRESPTGWQPLGRDVGCAAGEEAPAGSLAVRMAPHSR